MNPDASCHCLVTQSCPTVLQPHRLLLTRLLCPWDSPGKNTGVGCHALLHGIFLTQGSNLSLLHWQGYSLSLSHQRSPHMNLQLGKIIYHKAYFIIKCWLVHVIYWLLYLEKGMTIHSSILAWRVPWTEEPGGLQSMRSYRVGHDWCNLACTQALWMWNQNGCLGTDGFKCIWPVLLWPSGWLGAVAHCLPSTINEYPTAHG